MATFTEGSRVGDFLKRETDKLHGRDNVVVAAGQNLAQGEVVGRITASGEVASYNPAAADGTENAAGIMIFAVDATLAASDEGVMLARGPAVIASGAVVFGAGVTVQAEKDAAFAALEALSIVDRQEVDGGLV